MNTAVDVNVTREFLDGHWYLVERDSQGNIIRKLGDDPPPGRPPQFDPDIVELIDKQTWTNQDMQRVLKYLLFRSLKESDH